MNQPCKNCFYAIYDDKTQVGCQFNRIDTFKNQDRVIEAYDEDKEFYVVKDGCNSYNEWKYIAPEEAKQYIKLPYELIISSNDINLIKQSLQYSVNIEPKKIRIMYSGPEQLEERKYIIQNYKCLFTQLLEKYELERLAFEGVKQVSSLFFVCLNDGELLDSNFIDKCESIYNEELKIFDVIEGKNRLVRKSIAIYDLEAYKKEFPEKIIHV